MKPSSSRLPFLGISWLLALVLWAQPRASDAAVFDYSTFLPQRSYTNIAVDPTGAIYVGALQFAALTGATYNSVYKIDPTQSGAASLVWNHMFGGIGSITLQALDVDELGQVAIMGTTDVTTYPMVNAYTELGNPTGFVSVVNADGNGLVYSTRLGGSGILPQGVAFANGRVYVAGVTTDRVFPERNNLVTGGSGNAFLSVFDSSLSGDASLVYSTRFGDANAGAVDVAVDAAGRAYLLGTRVGGSVAQIPVSAGAFQTRPDDWWVAAIDPSQTGDAALIYATYLGGSGAEDRSEGVGGIDVDDAGNAFITGATSSTDFPTTAGAFQETNAGGNDVFVTKLNSTGTGVVWSTYVGGPLADAGYDVTVHGDASVSLTGSSSSAASFPLTACATATSPATANAAFVAHLSADGSTLRFSDFIEDNNTSSGDYVAAISDASMALLARTGLSSTPVVGGFQAYDSRPDFVAVLKTDPRCADLGVTIAGDPILDVLVGDVVTLLVQIDNPGPTEVQGVQLRVTIDPHLSLIGGLAPGGDCVPDAADWLCDVGTIAAGTQAFIELSVVAEMQGIPSLVIVLATSVDIELASANNQALVEIFGATHGGPCGALTYQGECVGSLLRFCQDRGEPTEMLHEVECSTLFPGVTGVCSEIDPVYGHDCTVPIGESCFYVDDFGNAVFALCDGMTGGCVLDDATREATCQDVGYNCTDPAGADFEPVCQGDTVIADCQARQPVAFDCGALGGSCVGAACVSLPAGSPCDGELQCDPSLVCHAPNDSCVAPTDICDPSTFQPTCSGSVVTYCTSGVGVQQQLDCSTIFTTAAGVCGTPFTCLDSGDNSCAAVGLGCHGDGEGAPCDLASGMLCGVGFGCLLEADGAGGHHNRCRSIGTCAFGNEHVGCVGDIATSCYASEAITAAEAAGVDCAAFGSSCMLDAVSGFPRCMAPLGGDCDINTPEGALFGCAPGLICASDPVSGAATCQEAPDAGVIDDAAVEPDATTFPDAAVTPDVAQPDAGPAPDTGMEPDAAPVPDSGTVDGNGSEEEEPGCACGDCRASAESDPSARFAAVLAALAIVVFVRRRRR